MSNQDCSLGFKGVPMNNRCRNCCVSSSSKLSVLGRPGFLALMGWGEVFVLLCSAPNSGSPWDPGIASGHFDDGSSTWSNALKKNDGGIFRGYVFFFGGGVGICLLEYSFGEPLLLPFRWFSSCSCCFRSSPKWRLAGGFANSWWFLAILGLAKVPFRNFLKHYNMHFLGLLVAANPIACCFWRSLDPKKPPRTRQDPEEAWGSGVLTQLAYGHTGT